MNCKDIERLLLLAQTGELHEKDSHVLKQHLEECEHCRQYESDLDSMVPFAKDTLPAGEPSQKSLFAVQLAAQHATVRKQRLFFPTIPTQAMAYAAVFMVMLAGWFLLGFGNQREARMEELSAILSMVDESEPAITETTSSPTENQDDLKELAEQLLRMEGLLADDIMEMDLSTPVLEPPPTTLRWRSVDGLPQKTCV